MDNKPGPLSFNDLYGGYHATEQANMGIASGAYGTYPYSLYYGEWVISEWISGDSKFGAGEEFIGSVLGRTVTMTPHTFSVDGDVVSEEPEYRIAIIPQNPRPYIPGLPNAADLGIDTAFFVYVHVSVFKWHGVSDEERCPIAKGIRGFYIKDDLTLYLNLGNDLYKLEKLNHVDDRTFYEAP